MACLSVDWGQGCCLQPEGFKAGIVKRQKGQNIVRIDALFRGVSEEIGARISLVVRVLGVMAVALGTTGGTCTTTGEGVERTQRYTHRRDAVNELENELAQEGSRPVATDTVRVTPTGGGGGGGTCGGGGGGHGH